MTDSNMFKVLLYSDGSQQSFSAAVYTAALLKNMPNIHLTVVQLEETNSGSMGVEFCWKELRPKFKRYYRSCSLGTDYCWKDCYPLSPDREWKKQVFENYEIETYEYRAILSKTNEIFTARGLNVEHLVLCSNTSITDTSATTDLIIDYALRNSISLIIMGERVPVTYNRFKLGDLANTVQTKSAIPVVVVKRLSQEFIDSYLLETTKPVFINQNSQNYSERSLNVPF